jgi:hypothetical protein
MDIQLAKKQRIAFYCCRIALCRFIVTKVPNEPIVNIERVLPWRFVRPYLVGTAGNDDCRVSEFRRGNRRNGIDSRFC